MMASESKEQVDSLKQRAGAYADMHGEALVSKMQAASMPVLHWLTYLNGSQRTQVADSLLDGVASSVRESAACMALGLIRPALFSVRTQIDLILAWLYFKDHAIEWRLVNTQGEGFKLKRELLDYLSDHYPAYKARFSLLKDVAQRTVEDPYRLLSAHVHAQSTPALPVAINLSDVVRDGNIGEECAKLVGEVAEYVSDVLVSVYAVHWLALPTEIRASVEVRLKNKKGHTERFFSGM